MPFLLDTHTFLWFCEGSPFLSPKVKSIIENTENDNFISFASVWEISIKTSQGKLNIDQGFESILNDILNYNIKILPIHFVHCLAQNNLPFHHKDPFDRMLISQALVENTDILGKDEVFDLYLEEKQVKRIW